MNKHVSEFRKTCRRICKEYRSPEGQADVTFPSEDSVVFFTTDKTGNQGYAQLYLKETPSGYKPDLKDSRSRYSVLICDIIEPCDHEIYGQAEDMRNSWDTIFREIVKALAA